MSEYIEYIASWKDAAEVLESLATVAAIIIGAIWTYRAFVRQRSRFPKLEVQFVESEQSVAISRYIRIEVMLRNAGTVVALSEHAELRLRQIVPLPLSVEMDLNSGYDPIPDGASQVDWPILACREWRWKKGEFEIEPGESDLLYADFFVPRGVSSFEIYFFIANSAKAVQGLGWTRSAFYQAGGGSYAERQQGQGIQIGAIAAATAAGEGASKPADSEAAAASTAAEATQAAGEQEVD